MKRVVGLVAVAAVLIAACGSSDDAGSGGSAEPGDSGSSTGSVLSTDATGTSGVAGTGVDESEPVHDPDAVLRVIGYSPPPNLDPVRGVPACEYTHLRMIYDGLVRLDENGAPRPGLAESWEVVDDLTFRLHLRPDVVFQDDTPFNAEAVKAHIERGQTDPESTITDDLSVIDDVVIVDDLTVDLILNEPRGGTLTTLLAERAGMIPSPTAVASVDEYGATTAVGAGPYALKTLSPAQLLSVRTWGEGDYWADDDRLLAGLDFHPVDDTLGIQRIQSGEIDYMATKDANIGLVKDAGDLNYQVAPTNTFAEFFINFGVAPFDDIRVREALNHALDRELLTEVLSGGAGDVAWGPFNSTSWAHNPDVDNMYPYDPDKARELLAEAGYPDGINFTVMMLDHPYYTRMAQAVQDMLADSGINIDLATVTSAESNNALYVTKEYSAAITAYSGSTDPSLTLERKYAPNGSANPSGQTIDGLEELLAKGSQLVDQDERAEIYKQAELLVMENAFAVPIYFLGGVSVFNPKVHGILKGYETCSIGNFIDPPAYIEAD